MGFLCGIEGSWEQKIAVESVCKRGLYLGR